MLDGIEGTPALLGPEMTLLQLLDERASPLTERELWAVCSAAATGIALQVEGGPAAVEIGKAEVLLVTPTAMVIAASGTIRLVPTSITNEDADEYLPPELDFERLGPSAKVSALVFSLAATLFMAADYNLPEDEEPAITEEMELLLSTMTDEDAEDRADLETVVELAADGLMVCEDDDDESLSQTIVQDLYRSADSIGASKADVARVGIGAIVDSSGEGGGGGGGSRPRLGPDILQLLKGGTVLRIVPKHERARPATVTLSHRDRMRAQIENRPTLAAAAEQPARKVSSRHISRIAPPPTYVTPHEALLLEITQRRSTLRRVSTADSAKPAMSVAGVATVSAPPDSPTRPQSQQLHRPPVHDGGGHAALVNAGDALCATMATLASNPTDAAAAPPSSGGATATKGRLKLLPLNLDILGGWDPNKQVQLGFLAEAGGIKHSEPAKGGGATAGSHAAGAKQPRKKSVLAVDMAMMAETQGASGLGRSSSQSSADSPGASPSRKQRKRGASLMKIKSRRSSRASLRSQGSASSMDEIPTPPSTIEVDDWTHIRANLIRADLENLSFDSPSLHAAIAAGKNCGICRTKHGYFKPGRTCVVCTLVVCATCSPSVQLPPHIHAQLMVKKPANVKAITVCKDCKQCLGGRMSAPNSPQKGT